MPCNSKDFGSPKVEAGGRLGESQLIQRRRVNSTSEAGPCVSHEPALGREPAEVD